MYRSSKRAFLLPELLGRCSFCAASACPDLFSINSLYPRLLLLLLPPLRRPPHILCPSVSLPYINLSPSLLQDEKRSERNSEYSKEAGDDDYGDGRAGGVGSEGRTGDAAKNGEEDAAVTAAAEEDGRSRRLQCSRLRNDSVRG